MNQKVLSVFKTNETQLSASEIVKLTGLRKNDVVKALAELKQSGQLKFVGGGKWKLA
jgi:DNA-binding IclR family transcriptional regulator